MRQADLRKVNSHMTTKEMLEVSGLNYRLQKRGMAMADASGDRSKLLVEPLKDYRAVVRMDTNRVFQVAKTTYEIHQPEEIIGFMRDYAQAGNAELEHIGSFDGGAVIFALAKLAKPVEIPGGSKLASYGLIATSHDGSILTSVKPTSVYVICWNTLTAALREKHRSMFRMKHTSKWSPEAAKRARAVLDLSREYNQEFGEKAVALSRVAVDDRGRVEYLTRLLKGESLLEQVVNNSDVAHMDGAMVLNMAADRHHATHENAQETLVRIGKPILALIVNGEGADMAASKGTLWGALNGVTAFVDHTRGRSADTRGFQALFGEGEKLKQRALKVAIEMAGIQ